LRGDLSRSLSLSHMWSLISRLSPIRVCVCVCFGGPRDQLWRGRPDRDVLQRPQSEGGRGFCRDEEGTHARAPLTLITADARRAANAHARTTCTTLALIAFLLIRASRSSSGSCSMAKSCSSPSPVPPHLPPHEMRLWSITAIIITTHASGIQTSKHMSDVFLFRHCEHSPIGTRDLEEAWARRRVRPPLRPRALSPTARHTASWLTHTSPRVSRFPLCTHTHRLIANLHQQTRTIQARNRRRMWLTPCRLGQRRSRQRPQRGPARPVRRRPVATGQRDDGDDQRLRASETTTTTTGDGPARRRATDHRRGQ
jgi:hypothetical protein